MRLEISSDVRVRSTEPYRRGKGRLVGTLFTSRTFQPDFYQIIDLGSRR